MTIDKLTPKQRSCAELAARGISNSEIAELMGVKPRTVKARLARIFALLGIYDGHKRTRLAALLTKGHVAQPLPSAFQTFPKAYSIAALVAQGLKNNEVARALGMTEHVVKNYLRALYDGSGMSNRTEFCVWWSANHERFQYSSGCKQDEAISSGCKLPRRAKIRTGSGYSDRVSFLMMINC